MKLIQAVIRPEKLDSVKDALVAHGINGITVTTVKGFGKQLGHTEVYRGVKLEARLLAKVMLSIVVKDGDLDGVVDAIRTAAYTGDIGDGKIIILPAHDVIRIRTGETGDTCLE
ncbi:MAG: P-II family nitrogen regulator [Cyanobacteriota bacterium]|nr:P-II family nitrogen regulator [Cyanobacteriota bacterium]